MRIAFCTTCKNRTQHLKQTLPRNLADNRESLFVVLNYGSQDELINYLRKDHAKDLDSGRLVCYSHFDSVKFRMAHAKNMAHRLGVLEGADLLVNLDADNFAGANFDDFVRHKFDKLGSNIFLWANMMPGEMTRGISGRIVVTQNCFLKTGVTMTKDEARLLCGIIPYIAYTESISGFHAANHGYARHLKAAFPEHNWRVILDQSGERSRWALTVDDDDPRERAPEQEPEGD